MPDSNYDETIFKVDDTSDLPIWVQLRNRIVYLIRTGYFKPGEQVPSVRSVSANARINYNTVTKAYKDLEQGGLIVSIRGRGLFVQKGVATDGQEQAEKAIDAVVEDCIHRYRSTGMSYGDLRTRMLDVIAAMEEETIAAAEKRMEYCDAQ